MNIKTNMPDGFADDLQALFEKYQVNWAAGYGDGTLYLHVRDEEKPSGGPMLWVKFSDEVLAARRAKRIRNPST